MADGLRYRTQIRQLSPGSRPMHIAKVLAAALPTGRTADRSE
jgi:hypothetical protein